MNKYFFICLSKGEKYHYNHRLIYVQKKLGGGVWGLVGLVWFMVRFFLLLLFVLLFCFGVLLVVVVVVVELFFVLVLHNQA